MIMGEGMKEGDLVIAIVEGAQEVLVDRGEVSGEVEDSEVVEAEALAVEEEKADSAEETEGLVEEVQEIVEVMMEDPADREDHSVVGREASAEETGKIAVLGREIIEVMGIVVVAVVEIIEEEVTAEVLDKEGLSAEDNSKYHSFVINFIYTLNYLL